MTEKRLILRCARFNALLNRLPQVGFQCQGTGSWRNSDAEANLQQICWRYDAIDPTKWVAIVAQAGNPAQIEADLEALGLCQPGDLVSVQEIRADLEQELSRSRGYWEQTIWPYVERLMRDPIQWYVVHAARMDLCQAVWKAELWNQTAEGRQFSLNEVPDLNSDGFREPELACKDPDMKNKLEQACPPPGMALEEFHRWRNQVRRDNESLPDQLDTASELELALVDSVTFDEILRSKVTAGHLPLLPPVSADGAAGLSKEILTRIIADFLQRHLHTGGVRA